ncbi:MAG: GNAT family N-acetyltransferase [Taibaiella sp.]|nr:GNAT family N-acetyltransferase [Taibaiella sp.]
MSYTIHPVQTEKDKKDFLNVAHSIYKADSNWVAPLNKQIHNIFEPGKNTYFEHGIARRWTLKNSTGDNVGRIAAFIDTDKKKPNELYVGGVGFFECINNQVAASMLFDTGKKWLQENKADAMDGPINFGENDRFWGLLVEGFTEPPFTTNYNHPYYQQLFENYGFKDYYDMTSNVIDLEKPFDGRFERIWSRVKEKNEVDVRYPDKKNLDVFAHYFMEIYHDAWQFHEEYKPITAIRALKFAKEMRFLFVKKMIPFVFVKGEPAGFLICTPDLNQIFKQFNGHINPLQLLQFMWRSRNDFAWYRKNGILTRGHAIAIGIKPKFQQSGLETGMIMSSLDDVRKLGFKSIELRWAGDFNAKINRLHSAVGAVQARKHITYRLLFDENIEFKRYKPIPMSRGKAEPSSGIPVEN